VVAVHGLFSGDAFVTIDDAPINKVYVSDSIQLRRNGKAIRSDLVSDKIKVVTISKLLAETIRRACNGESLKALVK
jgi:phosphoribosylpyrophosphate synthetase